MADVPGYRMLSDPKTDANGFEGAKEPVGSAHFVAADFDPWSRDDQGIECRRYGTYKLVKIDELSHTFPVNSLSIL